MVTVPPSPVAVPALEASSSCSAVGDSVLLAAKDAKATADAAGSGAQSLTWQGTAAEAADHAMTQLTNAIGDAAATLWGVVPELDAYAEAITGLESRREDLVTRRADLIRRRSALSNQVAQMWAATGGSTNTALATEAGDLATDITTFGTDVDTWSTDLATAEDVVIAALQAGDTAAEARTFREARSPELQSVIDSLVADGVLPEEMRFASAADLQEWLTDHPEAADALVNGAAPLSGPAFELSQIVNGAMVTNPGADVGAIRMGNVHDFFATLDPESAALIATLYPSLVGNTDGAPFAYRELANRVAVIDALADERALLEGMEARHEHHQSDRDFLGWNNDDLEGPLADTRKRIELYESILADGRSILFFEPATHDGDFNRTYDGGIAELHGDLGAGTENVGVMVPGTGTHMSNYQGTADRSVSLDNASGPGTAMISWMGGDFPDGAQAGFAWHTQQLGPRLAGFSDALTLELESQGASGASTTYVGHSYGGAVVGMAEKYGLDADRVVHVESAGMGHDIFSPDDLPPSQSDVERYSMTAPQDPITYAQGVQSAESFLPDRIEQADPGHGGDPDDFPGTVRLHTGDDASGTPMSGPSSHSAVLEERSDSWEQIRQVINGGTVEEYRSPIYRDPAFTRWGPFTTPNLDRGVTGWNDDGGQHQVGGG